MIDLKKHHRYRTGEAEKLQGPGHVVSLLWKAVPDAARGARREDCPDNWLRAHRFPTHVEALPVLLP